MLKLLVFFIVIFGWLIYNILWFRKHRNGTLPQPHRSSSGTGSPGKKYAWTWMQTAGSLQLKYLRPDSVNGYPAISGSVDGIEIMIQCQAPVPGLAESTIFSFRFPCPAGLDLEMTFSDDPSGLPDSKENSQSDVLRDLFRGRPTAPGFLQVRDPEILRCCMSSDCLDRLSRLSQIYPSVRLTDAELEVCSNGINNDLQTFRSQVKALLEIASALKKFAEKASLRQAMTVTVTESQLAEAEFDCKKIKPASAPAAEQVSEPVPETESEPVPETVAETEPESVPETLPEVKTEPEPVPEPVPQPEPAPAAEIKSPQSGTDILEKDAFLNQLWSPGMNFQKQRELFESYRGREVEWDGVLKMSFPFSSDFVFGNTSGVKASFELAEIKPENSFMPIRIKAVAAFAREAAGQFARAEGKHFRFRGKLLKIEPIARDIYLSDGIITEAES